MVGIQVSLVGALVMPLRIILRLEGDRGLAKMAFGIIVLGFVLQFLGNIIAIP